MAPRALASGEPVPVEVRVDARGDRGVGTPTVRIQHGKTSSGRKLQESVSCRDDGTGGDAAADDRLWVCRADVEVSAGGGQLSLVDGAGGDSERLLAELAVTLVPGRSLRWTWSARPKAWPATQRVDGAEGLLGASRARGAAAVLAAFADGSAGGKAGARTEGGAKTAEGAPGPGGPGGPGGQRLTQRIALPIRYESPARTATLPQKLLPPTWSALLAAPAALIALAAGRMLLNHLAVNLARRPRA